MWFAINMIFVLVFSICSDALSRTKNSSFGITPCLPSSCFRHYTCLLNSGWCNKYFSKATRIISLCKVCCDVLKHLINLTHLHKLLVIICNILLDDSKQHIVGIKPVTAILIYIFQKCLFPIITNKNVLQKSARCAFRIKVCFKKQ